MLTTELPFPELALLAGTRGLLGAGLGLLLAERVDADLSAGPWLRSGS